MHVPCENVLVVCRICQSCNLRGANECEVMTAAVQWLTCSGEEKWIWNWFISSSMLKTELPLFGFSHPPERISVIKVVVIYH